MKIWGPQRHESNDVTKKPTNFDFTYRYSCEVIGSKIVSLYIHIHTHTQLVCLHQRYKKAQISFWWSSFFYTNYSQDNATLCQSHKYIWLNKKPRKVYLPISLWTQIDWRTWWRWLFGIIMLFFIGHIVIGDNLLKHLYL